MEQYNFIVVGEICLDRFNSIQAGNDIVRLGGAFYSAYAAKKTGAKSVAILGHVGVEDAVFMNEQLEKFDILGQYIKTITGKATTYQFENIDEILPQVAMVTRNYCEINIHTDLPDAEIVLFYPYPDIENIIEDWSVKTLKALDVQYDIENILAMSCLDCLDVVFVSSSDVCNKLKKTLDEVVHYLFDKGVKTVVAKFGPGGSSIYLKSGEIFNIPAFQSDYICTIGAGDVYNAVFLREYAKSHDYERAGMHASAAAAEFIEHLEFCTDLWDGDAFFKEKGKCFLHPIQAEKIKVYLAGPFFSKGEMVTMLFLYSALKKCGFTVFSPWHAKGIVHGIKDAHATFILNRDEIDKSDIVVAILDYEDAGTVWECGYAYARKIPIYAFQTTADNLNLMVRFSTKSSCSSLRCLIDILYTRYSTYG